MENNEETTPQTQIPDNRDERGRFVPGVSGNPGGRPKGTMKEYLARKFRSMTDEEKEAWLIEHKITGIDMFKMAEGNPKQDTTVEINPDEPSAIKLD